MLNAIDEIAELYERRGQELYADEALTHLEHALQCARLAEQAQSPAELVVACLLHDVGELLNGRHGRFPSVADAAHPFIAACALSELFPASVLNPIRLHGEARRYLCRTEEGYERSLPRAMRAALEREGGAFTEAGAQVFLRERYAEEAILLARFDDAARVPLARTPRLSHYLPLLHACAVQDLARAE